MKRVLLAIMLSTMFILTPMEKSFAGSEPFLGEITIFGGTYAPRGFAFCEGQLLPISQYTALFSLLGNRYGGDGRTKFALPNLKNAEKSLNGARYIIALQGIFPSRN
jgi:microcystin-dependent protein